MTITLSAKLLWLYLTHRLLPGESPHSLPLDPDAWLPAAEAEGNGESGGDRRSRRKTGGRSFVAANVKPGHPRSGSRKSRWHLFKQPGVDSKQGCRTG